MKYSFIFILLSLASCVRNNEGKLPVIDLMRIENKSIILDCESVFKKMQYIQLETNTNCLLAGSSLIGQISENFILILSDTNLFLFGIQGNFVSKIGVRGEGPSEYLSISASFIDEKSGIVKIYDHAKKKILFFNLRGEFVKTVSMKVPNSKLFCIKPHPNGEYIVFQHISESYKDGAMSKLYSVYSADWKEQFAYYSSEKLPNNYKPNYFIFGSEQIRQNGFEVTVPFNDTIFFADFLEKRFIPKYLIEQGGKKMNRSIVENFEEYSKQKSKYYNNVSSFLSNRYVFLKFQKGDDIVCLMIYDMSKKDFIHSQSMSYQNYIKGKTIGIANKEDPDIKFWPSYFNDFSVYGFLDADYFKRNSLSERSKSIKENDNPIIIFARYL